MEKKKWEAEEKNNSSFERKPRFNREERAGDGERRSFNPNFDRSNRPYGGGERQRPERGSYRNDPDRRSGDDRRERRTGGSYDRPQREGNFERRERRDFGDKPGFERRERRDNSGFERKGPYRNDSDRRSGDDRRERRTGGSYDRPKREGNFERRDNSGYERPARRDNGGFERRGNSGFGRGERRDNGGFERRDNRNFEKRDNSGFERRDNNRNFERRDNSSFERRDNGGYEKRNNERGGYDRERRPYNSDNFGNRSERQSRDYSGGRPQNRGYAAEKPQRYDNRRPDQDRIRYDNHADDSRKNPYISEEMNVTSELLKGDIRLNRYVSMSGVCSRRDADALIEGGRISVNGTVVTELGSKVSSNDVIAFDGNIIRGERNVYILMNKPKDYVTTLEDPNAEKIVTQLLNGQVKERVYPVGRLDKNSLGVLLLTNDGEFTKILTHPSFDKKKIYHVTLDKPLAEEDMEKLATGVELEDGLIFADEISCDEADARQVGIEIHSGRNRVVRRMFEHLGYKVRRLDRVYFAGLTKKGLQRGEWRYLTQKEVEDIKRQEV